MAPKVALECSTCSKGPTKISSSQDTYPGMKSVLGKKRGKQMDVSDSRRHAGGKCTFKESQSFSLLMLGQGIIGTLLYTFATPLSASMFFRLTTGSFGFMLLSLLIVLFIISRCSALSDKKPLCSVHPFLFFTERVGCGKQ
jgi:hypothetical protein